MSNSDNVKHLQLKLDSPLYWLLKTASSKEKVSLREFMEEAVRKHCLQTLGVASMDEATELLSFDKEKTE